MEQRMALGPIPALPTLPPLSTHGFPSGVLLFLLSESLHHIREAESVQKNVFEKAKQQKV